MKCPYQTITIHKPEIKDLYVIRSAMDIVEFSDCIYNECPFYRQTNICLRAEKEIGTEREE